MHTLHNGILTHAYNMHTLHTLHVYAYEYQVAQLMWADQGRLSMMRAADYLNAATTEVEAAVGCYANLMLVTAFVR